MTSSVRNWFEGFTGRRVKSIEIGGQTVYVRSITERERCLIDEAQFDQKTGKPLPATEGKLRARYFVACVCNESGVAEFDATDLDMLMQLDDAIATPLFAAIREHLQLPTAADLKQLGNDSGETGAQD